MTGLARHAPVFFFLVFVLSTFPPKATAAPLVHTSPHHQSPVHGEPDDLLIIPGWGFQDGLQVVYQRLTDTTQPLETPASVPNGATSEQGIAPVVSVNPDSVVVRLPAVMISGESYALWIKNLDGSWSEGMRVNDARPLWLTPDRAYRTASLASLPRELKVVGRNLQAAPGHVTEVELIGPETHTIAAADDADPSTGIEHYVARIDLPDSLAPGTYQVRLTRDGTSWISVPDHQLVVLDDPQPLPQFDVSDAAFGGCSADDGLDDAFCIKDAVDAAFAAGGGDVVFPAGRWDLVNVPDPTVQLGLSHGIIVHRGVNLVGQGAASTKIVRTAEWGTVPGVCDVDPCVYAVFTLQGRNTVTGIHFDDEHPDKDYRVLYLQLGKKPWWATPSDPDRIEDVVLTHNRLTNMHVGIADGNFPLSRIYAVNNEFQVYKDAIAYGGNSFLEEIEFQVADSVVAHNTFYPGDYYNPEIGQGTIASQIGAANHLDFSHNLAEGHGAFAPPSQAGHCSTLPSGCGWRATHFWHMNNNHEMMLVSDNVTTCTGDKAGDGEAIVFDNNKNEPGFEGARTVTAADSHSVTVPGPWRLDGPEYPGDYFTTYWVQVADGKGVGQARKITGYLTAADLQIVVTPAWDIVPEPGSSRITVLRQDWQIHVVDNVVDIRGCEKNNPNEPSSGVIYFHGNTADSTIAGNLLYESDGVRLGAGYSVEHEGFVSWAKFQYFNEIRDNQILGEYNFNECAPSVCPGKCCNPNTCCVGDCDLDADYACDEAGCCAPEACCAPEHSWSGIELVFGSDPDSPSVVLGHGNSIAHNTVTQADALRGGAISIDRGWYPPPTPYAYKNTLIQHNRLSDLERFDDQGVCLPYNPFHRNGGVGIHIQEDYSWNTVLYANTIERTCFDVVDFGTDTLAVGSPAPGRTPSTVRLDRVSDTEVRFEWSAGGCTGAADYAIYEGSVGNWYEYAALTCTDTDGDLTETVAVSPGNRYYLVVPQNLDREGSYGADGEGAERPASSGACIPVQDLDCL